MRGRKNTKNEREAGNAMDRERRNCKTSERREMSLKYDLWPVILSNSSADYNHYRKWLLLITDIRESWIWGTGCNCCPNLDYKKPFHFLISWKQWTGTTVSCTALPALELMMGKNLKSPDCCLLSAKARTFSDIWSERNNTPSILEYDHRKIHNVLPGLFLAESCVLLGLL